MDAISVSPLAPGEESAWDSFVGESPQATFFHLSGWKRIIESAFGHKTFYLAARRRGRICGVLPLTQVKSLLFGNALISNAFCVRGGPVADDETVRERLETEAVRLGRALKTGLLEFRSEGGSAPGWEIKGDLYAIFRRAMAADPETNLKSIPRKQRAMIRKAITNGLASRIDEDVSRLHHVYAQSVRNLGTPVFPKRYFRLLTEQFRGACDVTTVMSGERPIASVLSFYFRDEVLPYYGGGTAEARQLAGNDFLYWEVMRRACERGYRIFDFGRSKIGTGSYDFKHNWGFEPAPLSYRYFSLGARNAGAINPLNPKYRTAIGLWQRLPLAVTKFVGPAIVRSIG
jgi:FemAB-related protein (PEP-CTERM system-associated)